VKGRHRIPVIRAARPGLRRPENERTGLLDRSALYGVLAEIGALGLDLLEIRKLTRDRESPESGDSRSP
jgi:hypothetical protein